MALPKLLQKLFTNGGAGDKLNQDIIPDIPYSKITDAPSVDSALSSTSENPVQNKVINSALDGKLSTSGGTVNGSIIFDGENYRRLGRGTGVRDLEFAGSNNDGCFSFYPGESGAFSTKKSASLFLTSTGYTGHTIGAGQFVLSAMDATSGNKSLIGSPDGSLTWGGKNVLTGNSAGLTVVAEYYSANSWYRKYSDGWIEQGGTFTARADRKNGSKNVALPIAFSSACYSVAALHEEGSSSGYTSGDDSRQYTTTIRVSNVTNTNVVFTWSTSGGDGGSDYSSVSLSARLYMCGK